MKITLLPVEAAVAVVVAAVFVGSVTCVSQKETVVTFNAGLTPTVYGYKDRQSVVIDAIVAKAKEVDFMCLQEFWFEEDIKDLLSRMNNSFPYHYSAIHEKVGELRAKNGSEWPEGWSTSPCSSIKLADFATCMGFHCIKDENKQQCMVKKCSKSLYSLSQNCRSCIAVDSSGAKDIVVKCANVFNKYNRINRPGLLVLSKHPLTDVSYKNFHPEAEVLLERGYIQAKTATGLMHVCTHLSANFPFYFEAKLTQFKSFEEEQRNEIQTLNKTFHGTPNVLMGDLNTGSARNEASCPAVKSELPKNMDLLTCGLHYKTPYLPSDGRCTYCPSENPVLKAEKSKYANITIDHVLTSPSVKFDGESGKRVFDDPKVMLSDHFGVQVDIYLP